MTIFRENSITVHISSDEMQAQLSISTRGAEFPSLEQIEGALQQAGVIVGVDTRLLRDVAGTAEPVHELLIAQGLEGFPGKADTLNWILDISDKNHPKITMDGKADYKRLHHLKEVAAGDEIVTLIPGTSTKPEVTVTGNKVESKDDNTRLSLPVGKNTRVSEDGFTLLADIDGVAMIKSGKVVIDTVYHIHGDVDFSTGNVKYQGTVMIDGDVRSGFRVEATDTIYVNGSVEAAEIYSKNGSVVIRNGVLGRGRARILAGDDLSCGFMQDATASVKHNVILKHYAINSNITSGGKISLLENEGLIRGGKTVAEKGIEVLVAGSERNILTEMVLSRSDVGDDQNKLWKAKIRLAEEYQNLDSLSKRLEFLELLRERLSSISLEREKELSKLRGDIAKAQKQLDESRKHVEELDRDSAGQSPEQAVKIKDRLHRKVTVTIGHKKYFSTSLKGMVTIYRKGDELLVNQSTEV